MIDLTTTTIKRLFEQQIKDLTERTIIQREDTFDIQFSGRWAR